MIELNQHIESFKEINNIISNEASNTLQTIEVLIKKGYSEKDILEHFNNSFHNEKYKLKTFSELVNWLRNIGI